MQATSEKFPTLSLTLTFAWRWWQKCYKHTYISSFGKSMGMVTCNLLVAKKTQTKGSTWGSLHTSSRDWRDVSYGHKHIHYHNTIKLRVECLYVTWSMHSKNLIAIYMYVYTIFRDTRQLAIRLTCYTDCVWLVDGNRTKPMREGERQAS